MLVVGGQAGCNAVNVIHHDGGLAGLRAKQAVAAGPFRRILQEQDGPGATEVTGIGIEVVMGLADGAAVNGIATTGRL